MKNREVKGEREKKGEKGGKKKKGEGKKEKKERKIAVMIKETVGQVISIHKS